VLWAGAAAANPSQDLARARSQFERGQYQKVVDALAPQLYPRALLREEDELKEAHYLLGVAQFFLDRRDKARQEFVALLYLDPRKELDPAVESPEVYAFFEGVKGELKLKLEELRREKDKAEADKNKPSREVVITRTITEPSPIGNFVPFGYGQFRNDQPAKGTFFLVSETLTGGASLFLFTFQAVQYGIPSKVPPDDKDLVRTIQITQIITGGLFLIFYGWGVVDSFAYQKPKMVEERHERPIESRAYILPMVTPDGAVGVGATWRF
jgi:hypothetical protein